MQKFREIALSILSYLFPIMVAGFMLLIMVSIIQASRSATTVKGEAYVIRQEIQEPYTTKDLETGREIQYDRTYVLVIQVDDLSKPISVPEQVYETIEVGQRVPYQKTCTWERCITVYRGE